LHTIEALAKECGYSERVHFSKTFKIFTGMTVAQADNYEKNNMVSTIITNENLEKKLG
jgi:AraC-like DNA-binding protein